MSFFSFLVLSVDWSQECCHLLKAAGTYLGAPNWHSLCFKKRPRSLSLCQRWRPFCRNIPAHRPCWYEPPGIELHSFGQFWNGWMFGKQKPFPKYKPSGFWRFPKMFGKENIQVKPVSSIYFNGCRPLDSTKTPRIMVPTFLERTWGREVVFLLASHSVLRVKNGDSFLQWWL